MNSIEDLRNEALGITYAPDPRRYEPVSTLKNSDQNRRNFSTQKDRDTASLGLGRMYENFF